MKKKKVIRTRQVRKFKIIDRLAWLIPFALYFFSVSRSYEDWRESVAQCFEQSMITGIIFLLLTLVLFFIGSIPLIMIWRAVSHSLKKSAIQNTTFNVLQDFDYYRDRLTGVSPADISMLTDLELETRKDISALVLKYTMMGLVTTDNGTVSVLNKNHPDLLESDRVLLNAFSSDGINAKIVKKWREMAKKEVVQKGYLYDTRLNRNQNNVGTGCGTTASMGCLLPLITWIATAIFAYTSDFFKEFNTLLSSIDDNASNAEAINIMFANSHSSAATMITILVAGAAFAAMILPLASLIYSFVKSKSQKYYKRTDMGEELTEEIYGMKNFIHDFSELSQADKEQLILWDDFLIYAVLLEENTSIVREICNMKQVKVIEFHI